MLIKPFQMKFRRARNSVSLSTVPGVSDLKNNRVEKIIIKTVLSRNEEKKKPNKTSVATPA